MNRFRCSLVLASLLTFASHASAEIALDPLFGDGMVLQRDVVCPMWGIATPNVEVSASIAGKIVATTKSDAGGGFKLRLPKLAAPGPYEIAIRAGDDATTLHDVLAGDVWICSGQSNMQWTLVRTANGDADVAAATLPGVRLYSVPRVASPTPLTKFDARWMPCVPATAREFSGVAYFFGRDLNRTLDVPIGLIHSSWGGTPAESWTPIDRLRSLTDLPGAQRLLARGDKEGGAAALEEYGRQMNAWLDANGQADAGIAAASSGWSTIAFDDATWKTIVAPDDAAKQGVPARTIAWFRRALDVPPGAAGKAMTLELSLIDGYDQTFVNGTPVDATGVDTIDPMNVPRRYAIPAGVIVAGRNVVAVRVRNVGFDARSGFVGNANQMCATLPAESGGMPTVISLAGDWRAAIERDPPATRPAEATTQAIGRPGRPANLLRPNSPNFPGSLYNGMIAPLGDLSVRGVIWYQGESNEPRAGEYAALLKTMIGAWREQFGQGDVPFYIVGLANYRAPATQPNQWSPWGRLREAQRQVARDLKNVATTVTIDVGDADNIHPKDKQTVGQRLANVALAGTYGDASVPLSPTLKSAVASPSGEVVVTFEHVGDGLISRGTLDDAFTIAGANGVFHAAGGRIDGDRVIVSSPDVPTPALVRYAYADNPPARLFNKAGEPAEPFEARTK